MHKETVQLSNGTEIIAEKFSYDDLVLLIDIYHSWVSLSNSTSRLGGRKLNVPDVLSEGILAYCIDGWRTNSADIVSSVDVESLSFDVLSKSKKQIEVKASSVEGGTLTSFSPKKLDFDKLVVMDFYANGLFNGEILIHEIDFSDINSIIMNKGKNETFKDQQNAGRRPRFELLKWARENNKIIKTHAIKLSDLQINSDFKIKI